MYRNNKIVGNNNFTFKNTEKNKLVINSETFFKLEIFGIKIYNYQSKGQEVYYKNKLSSYNSETIQNNKKKFCNIKKNSDNQYIIKGSSYNGKNSSNFIIGNFWNHDFINFNKHIKPSSCRMIEQKVKFEGKEELKMNNKKYSTLKFVLFSDDKSLSKDKNFKMTMWYDEINLILLKVLYNKFGRWEYRLKLYNQNYIYF